MKNKIAVVTPVTHLDGVVHRGSAGESHERRDGWTEDVGVEEADSVSETGERDGEINRRGALTDTTLAAGNGEHAADRAQGWRKGGGFEGGARLGGEAAG